jgi:3-dehydroquinate dehydratase II
MRCRDRAWRWKLTVARRGPPRQRRWRAFAETLWRLRWAEDDEDPTRAGREPDLPRPARARDLTAAELDALLQSHARKHGYALDIFYSNIEGEAINRIYQAVDEGFDGLVMNPAGFTYAGFALKDCVKGAGLPYVEVHISNIAKRSIHCVLSDVAEAFITGFGTHSYILGIEAMLEILRVRHQEPPVLTKR